MPCLQANTTSPLFQLTPALWQRPPALQRILALREVLPSLNLSALLAQYPWCAWTQLTVFWRL